jgi:hypothetical protein
VLLHLCVVAQLVQPASSWQFPYLMQHTALAAQKQLIALDLSCSSNVELGILYTTKVLQFKMT